MCRFLLRSLSKMSVFGLALFVVSGCVTTIVPPVENKTGFKIEPQPTYKDSATVVLGVKYWRPMYVRDQYTGERRFGILQKNGETLISEANNAWGSEGACPIDKDIEGLCVDGVGYHIFQMPPGTYAIGWFRNESGTHFLVDFTKATEKRTRDRSLYNRKTNRHLAISIKDAKMNDSTPRFSVKKNEVVYVGDIVFRSITKTGITKNYFLEDQDAAQEALDAAGVTGDMVYRPWTRPAGTGSDGQSRRAKPVSSSQ